MNDAGLYHVLSGLIEAKTKTAAEAFLEKCGDDYRAFCEKILARLSFKRTNDQNALYWEWVSEVGAHQGETKEEVHREAKLSIGCPILYRDNEKFAAFYRRIIAKHERQERLDAMDFIDVSSVMTTKQMSEFMSEFETTWRGRGVALTIPEDRE